MNRAASWFGWAAVVAAAGYWLLYVLVAPVTTADCQIYNLARLLVAERGGLFGDAAWTNLHQIVFPWSFDAVHGPFLKLGLATSLPSYLCLVGIGLIATLLAREQGTPASTPVILLGLLASPLVVFQASTSKNDLAVAFFALAAFYALRRWAREPGAGRWLLAFGVAVGMTAGAKSTGLVLAAVLLAAGGVVAWRQGGRARWQFAGVAVLGMALWGSGEIYTNNQRLFGHPLGPPDFVRAHANPDGLRGGAANLVRHGFNTLSTGLESEAGVRGYRNALSATCAEALARVGLGGAGFAPITASDTRFLLGAHEVASSYGVVAWLALPLALPLALLGLVRRRPGDAVVGLTVLGLVALAALSLGAGWQRFGMRLLLPAAVPLLVAGGLVAARGLEARPGWRLGVSAVLLALALAVPVASWNRGPASLVAAVRDREAASLRERLPLLEEWRGVQRVAAETRPAGCAVILGRDDWALPYLQDARRTWALVPNWQGRAGFSRAELAAWLPPGARGRWLVVASQGCAAVSLPAGAEGVAEFPGAGRAYLIDL